METLVSDLRFTDCDVQVHLIRLLQMKTQHFGQVIKYSRYKREKVKAAATQSVRDEVEEGVAQQSTRGEAEQNLEQVLVLVTVGLNWDEEEDEERSGADQQGGAEGLREPRGEKDRYAASPVDVISGLFKVVHLP